MELENSKWDHKFGPYDLALADTATRDMLQRWGEDNISPTLIAVAACWLRLYRHDEVSWREDCTSAPSDDQSDIMFALTVLLAEQLDPSTVADVLQLVGDDPPPPINDLIQQLIIRMIDRDATRHYQQIDGYINHVFELDEKSEGWVRRMLTDPDAQHLDGMGITKWVDLHTEYEYDASIPLTEYCNEFLDKAGRLTSHLMDLMDRLDERLGEEMDAERVGDVQNVVPETDPLEGENTAGK